MRKFGAAGALLVVLAGLAWAQARSTFLIDDAVGRDVVQILSVAPLEVIATRTNEITAEISFNPDNALDNPQAKFTIETAKLTTGIPVRDEHMRAESWFHVDQYPEITLELKEVKTQYKTAKLEPNVPVDVDMVGALTLRGVTKDVPLKLNLTLLPRSDDTAARLPGDLLRIVGSFDFHLSDFGLELDERSLLKIANRQQVQVWLLASTEPVPPPAG